MFCLKTEENTIVSTIIIPNGFKTDHKKPKIERLYFVFKSLLTNSLSSSRYFMKLLIYCFISSLSLLSKFFDSTPFLIFLRNNQIFFCHSFRHRPFYSNVRIIPEQSALIIRMIKICTFISKLRIIG